MQQSKQQSKKNNAIPLLELLAVNAPKSSLELLKKHGKEPATGYLDLQNKLKDLYASAQDKIQIEKEFAEIHPHKEFILKYFTPEPAKTKVILPEPESSAEGKITAPVQTEEIKPKINENLVACVAIVAITGIIIYSIKKL